MKRKYTEEEFINAFNQSITFRELLSKLGLRQCGGNYRTIKSYIKKLQLDMSHFMGQAHMKNKTHNNLPLKPLKEILIDGCQYNTTKLKKRLLDAGFLEKKCYMEGCFITELWNSKPIVLRLDHINGKYDDNRIENLRLLCPNCDSQTDTYCGKNKRFKKNYAENFTKVKKPKKRKPTIPTGVCPVCDNLVYGTKHCGYVCSFKGIRKVPRPTKDELILLIEKMPYTKIGEKFGVSDNAVRKWAKKYGILQKKS